VVRARDDGSQLASTYRRRVERDEGDYGVPWVQALKLATIDGGRFYLTIDDRPLLV